MRFSLLKRPSRLLLFWAGGATVWQFPPSAYHPGLAKCIAGRCAVALRWPEKGQKEANKNRETNSPPGS
jgi:hypothetical protein